MEFPVILCIEIGQSLSNDNQNSLPLSFKITFSSNYIVFSLNYMIFQDNVFIFPPIIT